MAFSLRKMLSNISYFSKPGDASHIQNSASYDISDDHNDYIPIPSSENIESDRVEADSTSIATSLKLPEAVKSYAAKKGSLSDTDLLGINLESKFKGDKKICRKLKLDIKKASQSLNESINRSEDSSLYLENTPKHKLLESKSAELFKGFNFNQMFDLSDGESVASSGGEDIDIESLSDHSDTDISREADEEDNIDIKMCRKVENETRILPSATPESFADVEVDKNEEERITLLLNYQIKLDKIECMLKKLFTEFEFHIEVSKIFKCKSLVTTLPGTDVSNIPKTLGDVKYIDNIQRGVSPAGWNIVMEKEDTATKGKLKNQLLNMRDAIDNFITNHLEEPKPKRCRLVRSSTFVLNKGQHKHPVTYKKKLKHFDFPDLREAMINLFSEDNDTTFDTDKCFCHCHSPVVSEPTIKSDTSNQSITSSIGNFTLDSTTLSAYSESLDQIVSYNSFNDTSLYNTLLQKAAIERITFYIQVHSIQLKCEPSEHEYESKNVITFHCTPCKMTEHEENGLLRHILSQTHCEKIHFVYKTAYVKKCISSGKEIQPSTVLNPMKMYRDDNKIVCFGDSLFACSLCMENLIVGESMLIAHCARAEHVARRERLDDIIG